MERLLPLAILLTWTLPTENEDGSPLPPEDILGFSFWTVPIDDPLQPPQWTNWAAGPVESIEFQSGHDVCWGIQTVRVDGVSSEINGYACPGGECHTP